ncbi:MAG TPA: hypothetical protein VNK43_00865 [Gemmatimonadales bacterium]|nr:hypothetical protein [Gemmatimonadales bacterium]
MVSKNRTDAINSYVTDMLSLERHIDKALKSQIQDHKDHAEVVRELQQIQTLVQNHINALEDLADERGAKGAASAVKEIGSAVLGFAAGAIDFVRNEGLPKNLRDDFTAASLAHIGYEMLHTTALALDDRPVADLALRHLRDYARVIMILHGLIPVAVVRFLRDEGLPAREDVVPEVARNVESAWSEWSVTAAGTDRGTMGGAGSLGGGRGTAL